MGEKVWDCLAREKHVPFVSSHVTYHKLLQLRIKHHKDTPTSKKIFLVESEACMLTDGNHYLHASSFLFYTTTTMYFKTVSKSKIKRIVCKSKCKSTEIKENVFCSKYCMMMHRKISSQPLQNLDQFFTNWGDDAGFCVTKWCLNLPLKWILILYLSITGPILLLSMISMATVQTKLTRLTYWWQKGAI